MDKQTAYIEFKNDQGKKIEDSIILAREDSKVRRNHIKNLTSQINFTKVEIDKLKMKLEKKEEERRMQNKNMRNEMAMDGFDEEGDIPQDDIIDEEELMMLKEMKDLKRDYRDNFSKLKGLKQELASLQINIDKSKEQMIYLFENWYIDTFEESPFGGQQIDMNKMNQSEGLRNVTSAGNIESAKGSDAYVAESDEHALEDEDAAVYRRAK